MIFKFFRQFFEYFKEDRKAFIKYSILSLFAGILELMGVALTYPFILKILSKDSSNNGLSPLFLGIAIILLFLLKNIFMIFYTNVQAKYTNNFEGKIKKIFMKYFLLSDYNTISKISFAQKGKIFGLLIPNVMNNFILRLLNININIFIFVLISMLIAIKFPIATLMSIAFAVLLICVQNKLYKPFLTKVSKRVSDYTLMYDQSFNEVVLNLKEIKISNNEKYFYDKYVQNQDLYLKNRKELTFFNLIPPYVTEPFVIILLFILLAIISIQTYTTPDKLVASFALIVSAIFRLAPTISRIQVNLNGINTVLPLVEEFIDLYSKLDINTSGIVKDKAFAKFNDSIELKHLYFSYDNEKNVLEDVNLLIKKGDFIGIAGLSGAGKTTLVDIISGLYKPVLGEILVDGVKTDKQLKIGYVPQEFCLINGNIRENVAFGNKEIDDNNVIDALKKAQLYDFIINNYKEGIYANPFVDSNGLSLGQRQRIAIARALYKNPDILILDEATSSLDLMTENEICSVLNELKGKMTIIVIAHRLSTIKTSDKILFIKNKNELIFDSYKNLYEELEEFRDLVNIANGNK